MQIRDPIKPVLLGSRAELFVYEQNANHKLTLNPWKNFYNPQNDDDEFLSINTCAADCQFAAAEISRCPRRFPT